VGCADLAERLADLRLKVHAFGHIHQSSGRLDQHGVVYVNACICDEDYKPTNPARIVDI
jgi:Icc-related predicted phosphoesterase